MAGWRPDVILLDLMMPQMDGWTFRTRQKVRRDLANVPVIIMPAAYDPRLGQDVLEPCTLLPKPFDLDDLLRAVEACLA